MSQIFSRCSFWIAKFQDEFKPLSLVSFTCMLQDTGYPLEVFMPPGDRSSKDGVELPALQERWVGWAVQIPGIQPWTGCPISRDARVRPQAVQRKFPLPELRNEHLGAILKIYQDFSPKPACLIDVIGITTTSFLPSSDDEKRISVPAIHVLKLSEADIRSSEQHETNAASVRDSLVDYLSSIVQPKDTMLGELLLLLLISRPLTRTVESGPLGTLSLNIMSRSPAAFLLELLGLLTPQIVNLPLSIPLLESERLAPKADDQGGLEAGILQLAEGTVLLIDEAAMGEGGQLNDSALQNLKILVECVASQRLSYQYPYMSDLKIDCSMRCLVLSEGKSLIPVDMSVRSSPFVRVPQISKSSLSAFRAYLAYHGACGSKVVIPDDTSRQIQVHSIEERKAARSVQDWTESLKMRLKIARLLAQSHDGHVVTMSIWRRAIELHEGCGRNDRQA